MILSRTMRPEDYKELESEVAFRNSVQTIAGPVDTRQHKHRCWEQALMVRALNEWKDPRPYPPGVADWGCGCGLTSPILLALGYNVTMYEIWSMGNAGDKSQAQKQMESVLGVSGRKDLQVKLIERGLGDLKIEEAGLYDAAFCMSVIEHIPDEEKAFRDLCMSVMTGGLMMLTMDFALTNVDNYQLSYLRTRIYAEEDMHRLVGYAEEYGFELLGGKSDWSWHGPMANDYSFSSLVMVRSGG